MTKRKGAERVDVRYGDMAEKLGLGREPDVVEYYNALLNVQDNPNVHAMPRIERIKTIAQAAAALGDLAARRLLCIS